MKVRASIKKRSADCKIVRRKGRLYVINKKKPLQVIHISKKDTQKKSQEIQNKKTNSQEEIKNETIASKPQIIKDKSVKERKKERKKEIGRAHV